MNVTFVIRLFFFLLNAFWVHMIYVAVTGLPVPAFYSSAWFRVFEMYVLLQGLAVSIERQEELER